MISGIAFVKQVSLFKSSETENGLKFGFYLMKIID